MYPFQHHTILVLVLVLRHAFYARWLLLLLCRFRVSILRIHIIFFENLGPTLSAPSHHSYTLYNLVQKDLDIQRGAITLREISSLCPSWNCLKIRKSKIHLVFLRKKCIICTPWYVFKSDPTKITGRRICYFYVEWSIKYMRLPDFRRCYSHGWWSRIKQ